MQQYIEITLLTNPDVNLNFLWSKLYQQLHLLLVEHKTVDNKSLIGFSFPQHPGITGEKIQGLGNKLRLHAEANILVKLDIKQRLQAKQLLDYLHLMSIKPVPQAKKTMQFIRVQPKKSMAKLARRCAIRHDISYEQALEKYADFKVKTTKLPYTTLVSGSGGGNKFPLYIDVKEANDLSMQPMFDTYGLTTQGGIAIF